ncbi:MAG: hypothetical protein JSS76_16640 [Bacteroidetes bacterium]|nr:hypothetical protein [Bacteroidota bacterium]
MDDKELLEINKYCSPYSLLVVTAQGILLKIDCPFEVKVRIAVDSFKKGESLIVQAVKMDVCYTLVYTINGESYYYYHFFIMIG